MQFSPHDVFQLVEFIWSSVLQRDVEESDLAFSPDEADHTMVASVMMSGSWSGALVLTCPAELARIIACTMFAADDEDVTEMMFATRSASSPI